MARLDKAAIAASLGEHISATPDPEGVADLAWSQGRINVAADSAAIGPAIGSLKEVGGFRWIAINAGDLFVASPKTIGTKVGILDPTGRVLKAADMPRPK